MHSMKLGVIVSLLASIFLLCNGDLTSNVKAVKFLQSELVSVGAAQQKILNFLASKNIPIGLQPIKKLSTVNFDDIASRIAISTEDNNIECRVSLTKAPIGSKCVAPCGCTGSQKWIQFSEFNRLRRNDPAAWIMCPTCQQKFLTKELTSFGGLNGNLVGLVLDNMVIVRGLLAIVLVGLGATFNVSSILLRFLTSRIFWQQWPNWAQIVRIPFPINFFLITFGFEFLYEKYLLFEKSVIRNYLIDMESKIIEESLPVTEEDVKVDDVNEDSDKIDSSSE